MALSQLMERFTAATREARSLSLTGTCTWTKLTLTPNLMGSESLLGTRLTAMLARMRGPLSQDAAPPAFLWVRYLLVHPPTADMSTSLRVAPSPLDTTLSFWRENSLVQPVILEVQGWCLALCHCSTVAVSRSSVEMATKGMENGSRMMVWSQLAKAGREACSLPSKDCAPPPSNDGSLVADPPSMLWTRVPSCATIVRACPALAPSSSVRLRSTWIRVTPSPRQWLMRNTSAVPTQPSASLYCCRRCISHWGSSGSKGLCMMPVWYRCNSSSPPWSFFSVVIFSRNPSSMHRRSPKSSKTYLPRLFFRTRLLNRSK
mmetsp:Transcript_30680/g.77327  ORF Transcript_30680/g.77327 Transcript_30680/m.77327 type:complete len:317 (-) Transcript_30680:228-1178(-)